MTPHEDLLALLAECHDDPVGFCELVLKVTPRRWQRKVMQEIAAKLAAGERHIRVLVRSCHGAGKTALAAILTLWWISTRPRSRGLTTAPTWTAVEGLLWTELAKLYNGSPLAQVGFGRLLSTSLEFAPAWDVVGLSTDHSVNLEGRHSPTSALRVIDEGKAVEPAIYEATEGLLDAPETMDVWISTPSIPDGVFYSRDIKGGPGIIRAVVTIDDLVDEGLPGKADWRAARLAEWGAGSPEYQSRALACYVSDGEGVLFPFAWVERAMQADFDVDSAPVAGLDVAGSVAGDETALALVAGPDELGRYRVQSVKGWHERDTQASKGRALAIVREAGAVTLRIDVVGLGKGLCDSVRADFRDVQEFRASDRAGDSGRFQNRKAEVAWDLRTLLEAGRIRLPADPKLKAQLLGMRYEILATGKIRVVDPSDSPDLVDAVLIALAGEVASLEARAWLAYAAQTEVQVVDRRGDAGVEPEREESLLEKYGHDYEFAYGKPLARAYSMTDTPPARFQRQMTAREAADLAELRGNTAAIEARFSRHPGLSRTGDALADMRSLVRGFDAHDRMLALFRGR